MQHGIFFLLGFATGSLGTLIGAGGGFLLAPLFLFLFPNMTPARLTALSLLAVCANSISGSTGYAIRGQIHWRSMLLFSLFAMPGVTIGVMLSEIIARRTFEVVFAILLMLLSAFVFFRSFKKAAAGRHLHQFWTTRTKVLGSAISVFIGAISSLLGIGGGIIHVPLLSEILLYPIHIAAGTSHSILAATSLLAVGEHFFRGDYTELESFVPYLIVGLVLGAQVGAAGSKYVASHWILRVLGVALMFVSIRLL